jgi:hypothetical protein
MIDMEEPTAFKEKMPGLELREEATFKARCVPLACEFDALARAGRW